MTSFVLLNDMKAEASWALHGLTCRLAQSLGLHRPQELDGRETPEVRKKDIIRRKLWYVFAFVLTSGYSLTSRLGGHVYGMTPSHPFRLTGESAKICS